MPLSDLHELLLACQSLGCAQTHSTLAAEEEVSQQGSTVIYQRKNVGAACVPQLDLYARLYCIMIGPEQLYHGAIQEKARHYYLYSGKLHSSGYVNFQLFMRGILNMHAHSCKG